MMDAVGTNVRIDARGRQVLRVLPRVNDDVNEEWASDKTRHHVDGLVRRRLDRPYVRNGGQMVEATWAEAFAAIKAVNAGSSVAAIAGDLADCETRSEEHTSELQSLMRNSYAVFCLQKKKTDYQQRIIYLITI